MSVLFPALSTPSRPLSSPQNSLEFSTFAKGSAILGDDRRAVERRARIEQASGGRNNRGGPMGGPVMSGNAVHGLEDASDG
jgi:hypothetical protein